jgi:dolichyl-phosphate-mannose-protein mannosyltransferase
MKSKTSFSLWIFAFFLTFFVLIASGRFGGDGIDNFLTAESIVLDGDLKIHDRPFEVDEMSYSKRDSVSETRVSYSGYGVWLAVLLVPFYCAGHVLSTMFQNIPHDYITQFAVSFFNPVILSILAVVLFDLLRRLGYSQKTCFLTTIIYSICTMNVVYSRSGFAEPMVALLVLLAANLTLKYYRKGEILTIFSASACIVYAGMIKKNSFILLPVFVGFFVYIIFFQNRGRRIRDRLVHLCVLMLPFAVGLLLILLQNKIMYGGVQNTEFGTLQDMLGKVRTDGYPGKGLYYYLLSPGKGYLIYNIAMVPGLFAINKFFKKNRYVCLFFLGMLLSNILFYSFIFVRGSLFSWGPRYLLPTLPFLAVFFAQFVQEQEALKKKLAVVGFAITGFLLQLPNFFINFSKYIFFVKEQLKLEEYLINFMPELSPIKGTWMLFLSVLNRAMGKEALSISFNPDLWFFTTIRSSLEGYCVVDIWFVNILKVAPSMILAISVAVIILSICLCVTLYKVITGLDGAKV